MKLKGFTLFELTSTLAIASILIFLGVPAMTDMWQRNMVLSELAQIDNSFTKARRVAVINNQPVVLCSLDANHKCQGSWTNTYDLFIDTNQNQVREFDEKYIQTHTLHERLHLIAKLSAGRSYIQYDPDGTTHGTAGSIQICGKSIKPKHHRAVIISFTGRLRRSYDKNEDGIHEAGSKTICQN